MTGLLYTIAAAPLYKNFMCGKINSRMINAIFSPIVFITGANAG